MPRRVSEGERNIIGLAYFFAMLNALLDNHYELSMTYEEKRKAARDILVIMKIINYKHVESCMTDKGNMRIISEWQRAIESRLNE